MWHCLWESYLTIIHVFQRDALYARDESRLKALLSFRDLSILSGPGRRLLSSSRARVFATLVFSEFIQLRMNGPEIAFPHLVAFRADLTVDLLGCQAVLFSLKPAVDSPCESSMGYESVGDW
jgi:hypothetical protein